MTFQVQDSKGAWSNIAEYGFQIEPADGNTRPICNIGTSSRNLAVDQLLMISWADSLDNDQGDVIAEFEGVVIRDGVVTNLSDYIKQTGSDNWVVAFDKSGTYEVRVRVCDKNGAWSNWVVFDVDVGNTELVDVTIHGITDLYSSTAYWVNQKEAVKCAVPNSAEGAQYLCDNFGSHHIMAGFPNKFIMDQEFAVSGRVILDNGSPAVNMPVKISMPKIGELGFYKTVYTDNNGYFRYEPDAKQYWIDLGVRGNIDLSSVGAKDTSYIRYSSTGTNFVEIADLTVSAGGASYSEKVICELGYIQMPLIGSICYFNGNWYYV